MPNFSALCYSPDGGSHQTGSCLFLLRGDLPLQLSPGSPWILNQMENINTSKMSIYQDIYTHPFHILRAFSWLSQTKDSSP